jgi:hypothetical protein
MVALSVKQRGPWQRPSTVSLVQLNVKLWAYKEPAVTKAKEVKVKNFSSLITEV